MDKLDIILSKISNLEEGSKEVQSKLEDLKLNQVEISYDVRRNADDLELHMKRTLLNEKRIETVEDRHENRMANIEEKLTAEHLLKLIVIVSGGISTVVGAAYGVIKLIDYMTK